MNRNTTEYIEAVETHNMVKSLKRLRNASPYDGDRWKRALYHAIAITTRDNQTAANVRVALHLP